MDSTSGGHGPDDTRRDPTLSQRNAPIPAKGGGEAPSGLGIGTLVLDANGAGKVTAVEWSVGVRPESIAFGAARPVGP